MTKQQPIRLIFRAERKPFDEEDIGTEFIFEGSYWNNELNNCHIIKQFSEKHERYVNVEVKPETLQISLDGENFHSLEFVREAIEYKLKIDKLKKEIAEGGVFNEQ